MTENATEPLPETATKPLPENFGQPMTETVSESDLGTQITFDSISERGAYVCNWSGHLLRVPKDGVKTALAPLLAIVGDEPLLVTKIATDPYISLTKARQAAANFVDCVRF